MRKLLESTCLLGNHAMEVNLSSFGYLLIQVNWEGFKEDICGFMKALDIYFFRRNFG